MLYMRPRFHGIVRSHIGLRLCLQDNVFVIALAFCLHENTSLCSGVTGFTVCNRMLFASIAHSAQHLRMNENLLELIMRFLIELISGSTIYTISNWFHATFRVFSFENLIMV